MAAVFLSTTYKKLTNVLDGIVDDKLDGIEADAIYPKWLEQKTTDKAFVQFLEMGGPGLVSEKPEGTPLASSSMREGQLYRHWMNSYGMRMDITEEAMDDEQRPQAIQLAKRLKRSAVKTVDYLASIHFLGRMFDANYPMGDGVAIGSDSHPLPDGALFSNKMATPAAPTMASIVTATNDVARMKDHDGTIGGLMLKQVVCPYNQWATWKQLTKGTLDPATAANTSQLNVAKDMELEVTPNVFWLNTTTQYAYRTNCESKPTLYWRKKWASRNWTNNALTMASFGIYGRFQFALNDPRAFYCVQAT